MNILTREEARSRGLKRYFLNEPCAFGHIAERFVNEGKCVECNRVRCRARYEKIAADSPHIQAHRKSAPEREGRKLQKAEASRDYSARCAARQTALREGHLTYQGRPCPKFHDGTRYASGGDCVACSLEYARSQEKKAYDLAYYRANVDRVRARSKDYYGNNKDRYALVNRNWAKNNPERRKAIANSYKYRRRQWEEGGMSSFQLYIWKQSVAKICHWCGDECSRRHHVDHYVPLSKGGKHAMDNLVIACVRCNLRKSARMPEEFLALLKAA